MKFNIIYLNMFIFEETWNKFGTNKKTDCLIW